MSVEVNDEVVTLTFVADTLTPVRAYAALRAAAGDSASFLLESVVGGERWGRYSILGYRPRREMTLQANGKWVDGASRPAAVEIGRPRPSRGGALALRAVAPRPRGRPTPRLASRAPTSAYLGWDLVHAIEKVPDWGGSATEPLGRFFGDATIVVLDALSNTSSRSRARTRRRRLWRALPSSRPPPRALCGSPIGLASPTG